MHRFSVLLFVPYTNLCHCKDCFKTLHICLGHFIMGPVCAYQPCVCKIFLCWGAETTISFHVTWYPTLTEPLHIPVASKCVLRLPKRCSWETGVCLPVADTHETFYAAGRCWGPFFLCLPEIWHMVLVDMAQF